MRRFYLAAKQNPALLVDADLGPSAVVIDVGAFEGSWSMRLLGQERLRNRGDLRIHAYEPEPGAIERCRQTISDEPRIELHPYGLAGQRRVVRLHVEGPGSTIYEDPRASHTREAVEIELRDVADELATIGTERVDLVKINIEGGEYELLDRLHETGWLPRIETLIVQFHEFAPDAYRARRRNRRQLAATHRCTWNYSWVYERWDRTHDRSPSARI
jgi:FkbM family methyltransferase